MTPITRTGAEALDRLFWRAEVLQALFWMEGEGLASAITPADLAEFLAADRETLAAQMRLLELEGYLEQEQPDTFRLTAQGKAEGGRSFHDEFAGLTRPAHGDCGPGCWCRDPDHAGEPCPNDLPAPRAPSPPAPPEEGPDGR